MFDKMFDDQTRCPNGKMCARQTVFDRQTFPIWAELSILILHSVASQMRSMIICQRVQSTDNEKS